MTLDELEMQIWLRWPASDRRDPKAVEADVQAILKAADAYAQYAYGITADRRAALDVSQSTKERDQRAAPARQKDQRAAVKAIHYQAAEGKRPRTLCGTLAADPRVTGDPADVTCWRCAASPYFPQAVGA